MGFAQPAVVERQPSPSTQKQQQLSRTPTHQPHTKPNLLPPKQKKMVSKRFAPLLASVVLAALVAFAVATDVPQNRKLLQLADNLASAVNSVNPAAVASPLFDQLGTTFGDVIPNPLSSLPGISGIPLLGDLFSNANGNLMSNSGTQFASSLQSLLGLG